MYCPHCSSENQEGLRFCTRCGTNLGAVSDALSGKTTAPADPMVELLKKYYEGRRSTAVGVGSVLIGLAVLAVALLMKLPENLAGVLVDGVAACALIYGAIAIMAGITQWVRTGSEMQALNHPALRRSLPASEPDRKLSPPKEYVTAPTAESAREPASVTEQTTRQLAERQ